MKQHYRQVTRPFVFAADFAADKVVAATRALRKRSNRDKKDVQTTEPLSAWEGEGGNAAPVKPSPNTDGFGVFIKSGYLSSNAGGDWFKTAAMHAQVSAPKPVR